MSSENAIHIKLNYMEALKAKKSILSSELGSLNISKRIERYGKLRKQELDLKWGLYVKIKETKVQIKKLQATLQMPKIPKILKRDLMKIDEEPSKEKAVPLDEGDIESQLREIQRRLSELQG